MGKKSPAKWIKTILLGRKASKSTSFKGKERALSDKDVLTTAKAAEIDVASSNPSFVPNPIFNSAVVTQTNIDHENKQAANISNNGVSSQGSQCMELRATSTQDASPDPDKVHRDNAATTVQASFRGYLARRAFWALKGIIRLQALIRGHLVRRQAVATLCCVMGVVKLQALARGRLARLSFEVCGKHNLLEPQDGKPTNLDGAIVYSQIKKQSANAFVCKLLSPSPNVMPLRLQYDSSDINSVSSWIERWSASRFWKPVPQPKKPPSLKSARKYGNGQTVEAGTGRPKRSVRNLRTANVDSSTELEKNKRNGRKVLGHPAETVQENPQNELEKVKRNLRRVHNPIVEKSVESEVQYEKPELSVEKVVLTAPIHNVIQKNTEIDGKTSPTVANQLSDTETIPTSALEFDMTPMNGNQVSVESLNGNQVSAESLPLLIEGENRDETPVVDRKSSRKEESSSNGSKKPSKKGIITEHVENGLQNTSPALPSYMQATKSAKAKLRNSPKSPEDGPEKYSTSRRQSLSSSANSRINSHSPRTERQVKSGGKGENKNEKSLLTSRDENAKVTQVEWRR